MSDVSCSPVVLSTQGMGGAQKAMLWPALPVHLCAHGNGRRPQEERKELEDCERTEEEEKLSTHIFVICLSVYFIFCPVMSEEGRHRREEGALVHLYLCLLLYSRLWFILPSHVKLCGIPFVVRMVPQVC